MHMGFGFVQVGVHGEPHSFHTRPPSQLGTKTVGMPVGLGVGVLVGKRVGFDVGNLVGNFVGAVVSSHTSPSYGNTQPEVQWYASSQMQL